MQRPLRLVLLAASIASGSIVQAQTAYGGQPFGLMPHLALPAAPVVVAPDLMAPLAVWEPGIGIMNSGAWHEFPNGARLWRTVLEVPGAAVMSVEFGLFDLPEAALVFLYNAQGDRLGAYLGNNSDGPLRTPRLAGERITVEYYEPAEVQGEGSLFVHRVYASLPAGGKTHQTGPPGLPDVDMPAGGGCAVVPPPEVNIASMEYLVVITALPQCCDVAWDAECQQAYDILTGGNPCAVDPPPEVDETSPEYFQVIAAQPECCDVAWSAACQEAYDNLLGPDCIAIPPATVDPTSAEYLQVIAADPFCCDVEWDGICQDAYNALGGGPPGGCAVTPPPNVDVDSEAYAQVIADDPDCCDVEWTVACQEAYIDLFIPPPPENDAAITSIVNVDDIVCGVDSIVPRVTIKNNGSNVLTSVILIYGVEGEPPVIHVWNGSLLPGQTYNYDLPPLPVPSGEHVLTVTSNSPNGLADEVPENDGWAFPFFMSNPAENLQLLLTPDNWGSDITWTLHSEEGTLLYSDGPYANGQNGQTMTIPMCLTNGCFTFTINDLFGDGICCASGQGNYVIMNTDGVIYAQSDGQYGFQNVDEICISGVSVPELPVLGEMAIFPNPTNGLVNVAISGSSGPLALRLTDGMGRLVYERNVAAGVPLMTLDLDGMANGMYLLSAIHEGGHLVQRVVLRR